MNLFMYMSNYNYRNVHIIKHLFRIISTIIIAIIRAAFLLFIIVQNYKIWCRICTMICTDNL